MPAGNYTHGSIYQLSDPFNDALEQRTVPVFTRADLLSIELVGDLTVFQPTDELPEAKTGNYAHDFGFLDYYNRIHYSQRIINLGNIVSEQTRILRVFNAYFSLKTLNDIVAVDDTGITFLQPDPLPSVYGQLQEKEFSFTIAATGPPNVDATYTFSFDVGDTVISIVGTRIIAWTWQPDWSREVRESLSWLTDLQVTYNGSEQRRQLREYPRQSYEFAFGVVDDDRRQLEMGVYGWGGRAWALPLWAEGQDLGYTATTGATTLTVGTLGRQFKADGLAVLLTPERVFETLELDSVTSGVLTLKRPLGTDWPGRTRIYPAVTARLADTSSISRFTGAAGYGIASFAMVDPAPYTAAVESTLYRTYPVMLTRPEWSVDPQLTFQRKMAIIDMQTGRLAYDDESGIPTTGPSYRWVATSRAELHALREFFYARKGRLKAVWVPTWVEDVSVVVTIGSASTNIDIEFINYTQLVFPTLDSGRRDLRIELTSGAVHYRRVTGASVVSETVERLSIDSALGTLITPAEIAMVSFMALMRLETDTIEISYFTGDAGETAASFRSFRNAV